MKFVSNKNFVDIVLQNKNNRRVDSYFALLNSHLNAIFQDLLTALKDVESKFIHSSA